METKYKFENLNKKYEINVIGECEKDIIYDYNGYVHRIKKDSLSRCIIDNPSTMISSSKVKYLNDTIFKNTNLRVISIEEDRYLILNDKTNIYCTLNVKYAINVKVLINKTTKQNKYRERIIEKLGNKFNYDKCWPNSVDDLVTIECPIHGEWTTKVSYILYNNSGCPGCANELVGYSKHIFKKSCEKHNNGKGLLYIAKLEKNDECFVKVGITSYNTINNRFRELTKLNYKLKYLKTFVSEPNDIYSTEKYIHKTLSNYKYFPKQKFNGRLECYPEDFLEKIIEIARKKIKNDL